MENLVYIIYVIAIVQILCGRQKKGNISSTPRGQAFYRSISIIDFTIGFIGMMVFNLFLRDKGIIPLWYFWTGFIGFMLFVIFGMIYFYKMMTTTQA